MLERLQMEASQCLQIRTTNPEMSIWSAESQSGLVNDLYKIMIESEDAELRLSYLSNCGTELARKQTGSYYTPADVAEFFWREFFGFNNLNDAKTGLSYLRQHRFIEPAAGAGALVFALFHKFAALGITPSQLSEIDLQVVDVNNEALIFMQTQVSNLGKRWGISFNKIKFANADFLIFEPAPSENPTVVFGNPPFVSNPAGTSIWKNLFADFVEKSLGLIRLNGTIHLILPISVAFSRDYQRLRKMFIGNEREVVMSHFDNIPDTLFKSGKPNHINSNKANSQRCTILTVRPSSSSRVLSSKLHSWSKNNRNKTLMISPVYYDVSNVKNTNQIIRPENFSILKYLEANHNSRKLLDYTDFDGSYEFKVANVARNYIPIRDKRDSDGISIRFSDEDDFYIFLKLISSTLFFQYWRSVGDGFHVTKSDVYNFPVAENLVKQFRNSVRSTKNVWLNRKDFQKNKLNSGKQTYSFDFSMAF